MTDSVPATGTVTPKLAAIRAYAKAGFTLIPLCSPSVPHEHRGETCKPKNMGKVPPRLDWQKTKPGTYSETDLAAGNWGMVIPETVVVVDVDPRNFGWEAAGTVFGTAEEARTVALSKGTGTQRDNPLIRLSKAVGGMSSYTVNTGGGGLHILFRVPAGLSFVNQLKGYPGIEFKSRGKQVVAPHSIHAISGKEYVAASGHIEKLAELPAALLALISKPVDTAGDDGVLSELLNGPAGTGVYVDDEQTVKRYTEWLENSAPTSGSYIVACRGRDFGLSPKMTLKLMLDVWNKRRSSGPRTESEFRERVSHAYKYAKGAVGVDHPAADFCVVEEIKKPIPKEEEEAPHWQQNAQGALQKTFLNLLNLLRLRDGGFYKIFAYNELSGRIEFVSPAPWHKGRMPRSAAVTDTDIKLLKGYLASRHKFEASVYSIEEAVTNVAYHERFHPVKEYLDRLEWDHTARLDFWLRDFLGVEDSPYSRAVGRKVLCAAVMRAFKPGIKFDHVLVLEGRQDLGKSAVCEILGGDWASDAPVDPHSRDTVDAMQGRWIIEIAELEVLRKTDEDALKAFITRRTDRCRLAYGRSTADFPRQSIFIATKNPRADGTYLKDDTGNRRWWPVRCEGAGGEGGLQQIDFKGLTKARDQLFAEAVVMCKGNNGAGEKLYMETAELKEQARAMVALRHAEHEWTEAVSRWIAQCDSKPETRRNFLTLRDVWVEAMSGSDSRFDQRATRALSGILRDLGWHQGHLRIGRDLKRVWIRESDGEGASLNTVNAADVVSEL